MLPVAEEVGWTGFSFARLQDRHGPMQNAIVNPTGLVGLVGLPQFEILVIMGGVVVVPAVSLPSPREAVSGSNGRQNQHVRIGRPDHEQRGTYLPAIT